jgi:hypothetical protein
MLKNFLESQLMIFFPYDVDDVILAISSKTSMLILNPISGVRPSLSKVEGI